MRNLYSVLNLSRRANSKDIKTAYWALAKQFHPDVNAGNHDSERWTKEINRAYEILGDPDARTAYDLEIGAPTGQGADKLLEIGSNRRSNLYTNGGLHLHGSGVERARVEDQKCKERNASARTKARRVKIG